MKRVLVLNANLRERGTWFRARKIARGLYHRGHDVTFVCQGERLYRPVVRREQPRWHEWETSSWSPLRIEEGHAPLAVAQRLLRLRGPWDLIYTFSHLPVDSAVARLLRSSATFWMTDWCDLWNSSQGGLHDVRLWAKPLPPFQQGIRGVVTRLSYRLEDALEGQVAASADAVSVIATPMLDYTRRLAIPDDRVLHLISGADTVNIRPLDRAQSRRALGLPDNALLAVYIANFTPDNEQLEGALQIAMEREPRLRVVTLGHCWYAPGGFAARMIRAGRIMDRGRQPFSEVPTYLGAADFLLMPIRDTPLNRCRWPNKFGDYMASGRATATTMVGDMGRVCVRHEVGLAGSPTADGLADAITALAGDAVLRERLGQNALHAANHAFSWGSRVHRLAAYLKTRGITV